MLGYVQGNFEVSEYLRTNCTSSTPVFKNNIFSQNNINDLLKNIVEEEGKKSLPRKLFNLSFI